MKTPRETLTIFLFGSLKSGKTQLIQGWIGDGYTELYDKTFTVDLKYKIDSVNNKRYQLYDTSGDEQRAQIINSYCKNPHAVLITVDLSDMKSWEFAEKKIQYLKDNHPNVPFILAGTKLDSKAEGMAAKVNEYNQKNPKNPLIETSAKTGENVDTLFTKVSTLASDYKKAQTPQKIPIIPQNNNNVITINQPRFRRGKRFAIGLGISLLVIAALFFLVAAAYLLLPAAAGTFMAGLGLAIAKLFSIKALTAVLSTASAPIVIAVVLGAIAAAGVAALSLIANGINGVRHLYGSAADRAKDDRVSMREKDFQVYEPSPDEDSVKKMHESLGVKNKEIQITSNNTQISVNNSPNKSENENYKSSSKRFSL